MAAVEQSALTQDRHHTLAEPERFLQMRYTQVPRPSRATGGCADAAWEVMVTSVSGWWLLRVRLSS